MRTYELSRRISHADVDFLGELKVSALLGLLEQAAVEASTAAGYDAARYTAEQRVWIIRRTRLRRLVPVGGCDEISVRTAVADIRRARSLRRYQIFRGEVTIAEATTDWVYCDLLSGRPTRIPLELQTALFGSEVPTLPRAEALPADPPETPVSLRQIALPSHLDHVRHVNNAIYTNYLEDGAFALFAARGWPLERMFAAGGALRIDRLDAEYLKDASAGDVLDIRTWSMAESGFNASRPAAAELLQTIVRDDGSEMLRAHSHWAWRTQPAVLGGVPS